MQVAFAKIAGEAGGGDAIVFGEGGVAIDAGAEAFAEVEFGVGDVEVGVKRGAGGVLDAVVGPEGLFAVRCVERVSEGFEMGGAGEGDVAVGMPVLGEDDVIEAGGEGVDAGDDLIAAGDCQRAAGQEVELHVDDEKSIGGSEREGHALLYESGRGIGRSAARRYPVRVTCPQSWLKHVPQESLCGGRRRPRAKAPLILWSPFVGLKPHANPAKLKADFFGSLLRPASRKLQLLGVLAVCVAMFCVGARAWGQVAVTVLPDAPSSLIAAQAQADKAMLGSISGTVTDSDGDAVRDAQVTLTIDSENPPRKVVSGSEGEFRFVGVAAGKYTISVTAAGMAGGAVSGILTTGQSEELPPIALPVASVASEVDAMSVHDQAEGEMKVEEHQRLLGIVPNFYVAYNWNSAPLNTKQKFKLAVFNVIDPVNIGIDAAIAGYQQWQGDFNGYGTGPASYGERFGANYGDLVVGTFVGGAILPSILHQDPRYFYMGKGTVMHRFLYAVASAVICKGDNGKWQPNYSSIGGDVAAGAIANVYYPKSDKDGASVVIEQGLLGALGDGLGNVVQEFLFKKVTPHSAKYSSTTP